MRNVNKIKTIFFIGHRKWIFSGDLSKLCSVEHGCCLNPGGLNAISVVHTHIPPSNTRTYVKLPIVHCTVTMLDSHCLVQTLYCALPNVQWTLSFDTKLYFTLKCTLHYIVWCPWLHGTNCRTHIPCGPKVAWKPALKTCQTTSTMSWGKQTEHISILAKGQSSKVNL